MNWLGDHDVASLGQALHRDGFPALHAAKLLREFYRGAGEIDFVRLNVGPRVKHRIEALLRDRPGAVLAQTQSADGTLKLLVGFGDGRSVESVLMPGYRADRAAACVSSQVGCAMGCDFCASTRGGLERNLTAGEIVDQFLFLKREATKLGRRLVSLVFMGMGEPMHNLDNVIAAVRRIADPDLGGLGWRQVTVSTVGIVPGINRLADADLNINLALSLHAPDDATREGLVPANRRYAVADVMAAARRFAEKTGRVVTIEYCLLADVNDSGAHAAALTRLMHGFRAHVNLIPYNPIGRAISGTIYRRPSPERVAAFLVILRQGGVVAHARDARGGDVAAACGQLRTPETANAERPGGPTNLLRII
ncbi:MAG TPA: 23S rRNA (adenine(2503)-C(2))-methyltransferase RlmN [Tepidisphaeraceae bacterium]|nr:23S rRNA (adenine(2503)-C(2))-methyltransferase RlmN [Tepidisphaeraceae bacterium]